MEAIGDSRILIDLVCLGAVGCRYFFIFALRLDVSSSICFLSTAFSISLIIE